MKKLHIIGSGGFAKELIAYIENEKTARYDIKGVWSADGFNNEKYQKYYKGNVEDLKKKYKSDEAVIIAIANNDIRKKIVEKDLNGISINFISYIHPSCEISKYSSIGVGCIFGPGCVVCADAKIQNFNFFNTHCTIGHDTKIGSYNCFFPKVEICGSCEIFSNCIFGINSILFPEVKMHPNSKLDAGSILRRSTKEEGLYYGNPARLIKK